MYSNLLRKKRFVFYQNPSIRATLEAKRGRMAGVPTAAGTWEATMPGERDGACEAFECAYRSPFAGKRACRRFAQTRRTCGRRVRRGRRPCRRARARRTARSPCRRAWADCPPRARRTHAPRAHPARRQGFSGYREVPTVCSKARKYTRYAQNHP